MSKDNEEKKSEEKKRKISLKILKMKEDICGKFPSPFMEEYVMGMPEEIFIERINASSYKELMLIHI